MKFPEITTKCLQPFSLVLKQTSAEQNPLVEIVEIDRRHFLKIAGGTLVALSALGLSGCAGHGFNLGGSSSGVENVNNVSGTIQLPSGTASTGTLTVGNGLGSTAAKSNNAFSLRAISSAPSIAYVTNSAGNVILMGFVDPSTSSNVINALSTATVLLYFALDTYAVPTTNMAAVIGYIQQNAATVSFASTIASRIGSNVIALDQLDSQITSALAAAFNSITGGRTSNSIKRSSVDTSTRTTQSNYPPSVLINAGTESGFTVNQDPSLTATVGVIGQNAFRRYTKVYLYETGTADKAGNQTLLSAAKLVGQPILVDSTQRLNLITSLSDLLSTTSPFAPVDSASIPLALDGDVGATYFELVVIGSSASITDPTFFSDPKYANEVATWRQDLRTVNIKSAFADLFFGLILNLLGVTTLTAFPAVTLDAAIAKLEAIQSAAWLAAIEDAASGANFYSPLAYAASVLKGGSIGLDLDPVFAADAYDATEYLLFTANKAAAQSLGQGSFLTAMGWGARIIIGAITGASLVLGLGDLAAVVHDLASSDKGDVWPITLKATSITITPATTTISPGATASFSVKLPSTITIPPNQSVIYDWSQTGGALSILTDNAGISGQSSIETAVSTVSLVTTASQQSNITITVSAYFLRPGGQKTLIDTATASVTISQSLSFPANIVLGTYASNPNLVDETFTVEVASFYCFTPLSNAETGGTGYYSLNATADGYGFPQSSVGSNTAPLNGSLPFQQQSASIYPANVLCYDVAGQVGFFHSAGYVNPNFPTGNGNFQNVGDATTAVTGSTPPATIYYHPGATK